MNSLSTFIYFLILIPALHSSGIRTPYLGTGYDLRVANPEGNSLFTDESDPGLKPTRPIILQDQEFPPWVAVVNNRLQKEYLSDDMFKYYRQIQDRWNNLDEDGSSDDEDTLCDNSLYQPKSILKVGGSCKSLKEAKRLLTVKKDVMVTKEISHVYTEARLYTSKFNLNPEFKEAVCNKLPKNLTTDEDSRKKHFNNLFKTWGTHVITELTLGKRELQRSIYNEINYFNAFSAVTNTNDSIKISSNYDPKFIPKILEALTQIEPDEKYNFAHGSKEVPIPIRMHLEPISNFVSCSSSPSQNNSVLKEIMEEATKDYIASGYNKEDPQFVVREYYNALDLAVWPRGTFSLPKPKAGCPTSWVYGHRHHDTEDYSPRRTSYHEHWKMLMNSEANINEFEFKFCSKTNETSSLTREWGIGSYCVFKYGSSCPDTGFTDSKIFFDDEDSGNLNGINGTLPSGQYNTETRYDLCCRDDGSDLQLFLPNKSPFVLLPVRRACNEVLGMNSKMLWVVIHGEETKISYGIGSPRPLFERSHFNTFKLFFCYYQPIV